MKFHKLIPNQSDLINVAVPFVLDIGKSIGLDSLLLGKIDVDDYFNFFKLKEKGLFGSEFTFKKDFLYIGPKIKTDFFDLVLGIDKVDFVSFPSSLEYPDDENLQNIVSFDPVERYASEKIYNQGFYDYDKAIEMGNELISGIGLREGQYEIYGNQINVTNINEFETCFIVAVPNNRERNPTICGTLKYDIIPMFLANLEMLHKDYYNFYISKKKLEPGKYIYGFINLSSVVVMYNADTGIYLDGMRDHQSQ